jgi:hypothetical protein
MKVRFSKKVSKKTTPRLRYLNGTIILPRAKRLVAWPHTIDWVTDSFSHEALHDTLEKRIGHRTSVMLDVIRVGNWDLSPDRAGLHLKPHILEKLDYTNFYVPLADT